VKEKRRLKVIWDNKHIYRAYCMARAVSKKLIASAKEIEILKLGKILINKNAKYNIFRIVKQIANKQSGCCGAVCVKDVELWLELLSATIKNI